MTHIDIDQVTTGGLRGTSEKRVSDWKNREHSDHIFGNVIGQSRFVRGSADAAGKVRPNLEVLTQIGGNGVDDETVRKFLRGEILTDGEECEGFLVEADPADEVGAGEGLFFQSWVVNQDPGYGWTAEQVFTLLLSR